MTKKQKKNLIRILASGVLYAAALLLPKAEAWEWAFFIPAYILISYDVLWGAVKNLLDGRMLDERFLMSVATLGAWAVGDYPETVAVMLFYQVGELFQSLAVERSRKSIGTLMELRPDSARVFRNGDWEEVDPDEVEIGEKVLVRPGERVPLDGVVLEGDTLLDTMALTGEAMPRHAGVGDAVNSGVVNTSGVITLEVTKLFGDSTVARILELVENSADNKSKSEAFITRFARVYTPAVVVAAVLVAVIPSLITGDWNTWVYRGLSFLVVSCPCALVISVPLSFFGGIGGAAKQCILVKGSNYLEKLGDMHCVAFDKTGTLTTGKLYVHEVCPAPGVSQEELLKLAAAAEHHSSHPIAACIREAAGDYAPAEDVSEQAGYGVSALVAGKRVHVGGRRLMEQCGVEAPAVEAAGTLSYVEADGKYMGYVRIGDAPKAHAKEAIQGLRRAGVSHTVLLTGDRKASGEALARELGIDEARCELLPGDKVTALESIMKERPGQVVGYVGDGINDAPVLARADVGVAMGALGADAAIEAADVVLMDDDPSKLPLAVAIARRTRRIVKENIVFALGVKLLVLALTAIGITNMWGAVFGDVGVAVIAILNALRCLRPMKIQ